MTDDAFNEEFKPLHFPAAYHPTDSWQDKLVFALAELGLGTADEVADELYRRDNSLDPAEVKAQANTILPALYKKGLIKASELHHGRVYNLSKILIQNSGSTNPPHGDR